MDTLYIFIDETGSFSYRDSLSYVGGWVSNKRGCFKKVENKFQQSVKKFNTYLKSKDQNYSLDYPTHTHFMPLHLKDLRTDKDLAIPLVPKYAPVLCQDIFDTLREETLLVFKSSGKPAIIANEQAAYIDILRNTLIQLLDEDQFVDYTHIKIIIGHRRAKFLYGREGMENTWDYEKYMAEKLAVELKDAFEGLEKHIKIEFDEARLNSGLILADFYCGALRWSHNNYLESYQNLKTYPFANGYRRIGARLVQHIKFLNEIDSISAAVQCLEVLSTNSADSEMKSILKRIVGNLEPQQKSRLYSAIIDQMEEHLIENPDRYLYLDWVENMIGMVREILPSSPDDMGHTELRLEAACKLNQIRITSHRGQTTKGLMQTYLDFLEIYGNLAFENQMEIMQQRIEAVLMGSQVEASNTLQFEGAEEILKETRDAYYHMVGEKLKESKAKDSNMARLEGTLGQMYAFQYDLSGDEIYYQFAEDHLLNDVSACIPGSTFWRQGMGFLTVLYWKKGDLSKCCDNFLKESEQNEARENDVFDLADSKRPYGHQRPFLFLHHLNLCALACYMGKKVKNLEKAR
ncbi:MAG: DUF3800 domain-containing protein, partial [Deltaproteobacteria bacterium]|nr:DUF3800 domain-containing protein [Deltaproteobacteria bacterium]